MPQGRMFSAGSTAPEAVTAARDLVQLSGATGSIAFIHSVTISQTNIEGDANAEMLGLEWFRCTTLGAGTAMTEQSTLPGDTAAHVAVSNAVLSTGLTQIGAGAMNLQAGWDKIWHPEPRILVPAVSTEGVCFQCEAPDASTTFVVNIEWEEIATT